MRILPIVVLAACAPATLPLPPNAALLGQAPGGWRDRDGTYHSDELPLAVQLPDDAELAVAHLAGKSVLVGRFGDAGVVVQWWQQDGAVSSSGLDEYIESLGDTEAQLDGDAMATVAMGAAARARGKAWVDPASHVRTSIRVGWKEPWVMSVMAWTPDGSPRAGDVDRAVASLAFL
jgi:hypothetical protein